MADLVYFDSLAGIPAYYAKSNAAYGDLDRCAATRTRKLDPEFLRTLEAAIHDIDATYDLPMGRLDAITSGGAYVRKPGQHGVGRAYDLGGLHWRDGRILTCIDVARAGEWDSGQHLIYLGAEACLRKWFGTVLGIHFDRRHWNHWHCDTSTPVGYRSKGPGSRTRVRFLQETLTWVWRVPCGALDGVEGPKTRTATRQVLKMLGIAPALKSGVNWIQYLTRTALEVQRFI